MPYGTRETFIIPEVKELLRQGHDILIVPMYPDGPILHEDTRTLERYTCTQPLVSIRIVVAALSSIARKPLASLAPLFWIAKSRSRNILFKNLAVYMKGLWLGSIAQAWGAEHIHTHWASTPSTLAMIAAEIAGIPWSITAHRWDIAENNLLSLKAKKARFIRAINERGADEIVEIAGLPGWRPIVIHMGVPLAASVYHEAPKSNRVLMAANFVEKKGHIFLLEAIKLLHDWGHEIICDLAGDGPLRSEMAALAKNLAIAERVNFIGSLSHQELIARMENGVWDIATLPSVKTASGEEEGIPVFLIEAMSVGIPVVATATGGIPELLHGGAGILVPQKDAQALAHALQELIGNKDYYATLSLMGCQRIKDEFSIETVAAMLARLFKESCAGGIGFSYEGIE